MSARDRVPTSHGRGRGYSLVEVLVAAVLLQVGLLGAAGLVVTGAHHVASAIRIETALSLSESVADSLIAGGWGGAGSRSVGSFLVSWAGSGGWASVEVRSEGERVVGLSFPVVEP